MDSLRLCPSRTAAPASPEHHRSGSCASSMHHYFAFFSNSQSKTRDRTCHRLPRPLSTTPVAGKTSEPRWDPPTYKGSHCPPICSKTEPFISQFPSSPTSLHHTQTANQQSAAFSKLEARTWYNNLVQRNFVNSARDLFITSIPPILVNRFMLNLRQINNENDTHTIGRLSKFSALQFHATVTSSIFGNFGEPLERNASLREEGDEERYQGDEGLTVDSVAEDVGGELGPEENEDAKPH